MSRYIITSKAFALVACTFLLVAAIGCSPGTLTDPSSTPQNVVVSPNFISILSASPKTVDGPNFVSGLTSKIISAEDGGVVTNGRITLEIPPFALSEDTEITIEILDDGTLGVELGPHGIQFNRPVTMTMDLRGTSAEGQASAASTLWWNEEQGWFEMIEKIYSTDPNSLSSQLEHFSKYSGVSG